MLSQRDVKKHRYYLNWEFIMKGVGGGILLVSFITQNYFYDAWNSKAEDSHASAVQQSLVDKSTLLNEALYFTARADESFSTNDLAIMRQYYIREAARKSALAKSIWILASDLDRDQKLELTNTLMGTANSVKDFAAFSAFNKTVNEMDARYANIIRDKLTALEHKRNVSRTVYLTLYILGGVLVASSLLLERKRMLIEAKQ